MTGKKKGKREEDEEKKKESGGGREEKRRTEKKNLGEWARAELGLAREQLSTRGNLGRDFFQLPLYWVISCYIRVVFSRIVLYYTLRSTIMLW